MAITRIISPDAGVGSKLTSAQINGIDANVTNAADKRAGQTDTIAARWTCSGVGRLIPTSVDGANADTNYQADGGNTVIRVTSTVAANRIYTLTATNAQDGDRIEIYCEPSFNFTITVRDQALATMFRIGNNADGTWAEFIYKGASWRLFQSSLAVLPNPTESGFRLCGTSVSPATDTASTTSVFLTPFTSNRIALYDTAASRWRTQTTGEVSLPLGTLTSDKNYDVFAYWTGTAVALEFSAAWTTDTARADAVVAQDGVLVKSSDHSRRLVGTIRTISTTQTADSPTQRFIWNASNRLRRSMTVKDSTYSWTYPNPGGTFRYVRGQTSNKVEYVCGELNANLSNGDLEMRATGVVSCPTTSQAFVDIGFDTGENPQLRFGIAQPALTVNEGNIGWPCWSDYVGKPALGYHLIRFLETGQSGSLTYTFYGNTYFTSAGLNGTILM
jgi:hypothetical protein